MINITCDMPGFTAEATLCKTNRFYGMATTPEPTQGNGTVRLQRATGPTGPIGLPGQDCAGACLHMCMTFGGGSTFGLGSCMAQCLSTCTDLPSKYHIL
jgi:hypothetical protein